MGKVRRCDKEKITVFLKPDYEKNQEIVNATDFPCGM